MLQGSPHADTHIRQFGTLTEDLIGDEVKAAWAGGETDFFLYPHVCARLSQLAISTYTDVYPLLLQFRRGLVHCSGLHMSLVPSARQVIWSVVRMP